MEVERSDARHMLIECLSRPGTSQEAATNRRARPRGRPIARRRLLRLGAGALLPAYFLGEWDEALEMAARVREAWTAADRPPVAALAIDLACAAAIYEYRGDPTRAADWWAFAEGLLPEKPRQHAAPRPQCPARRNRASPRARRRKRSRVSRGRSRGGPGGAGSTRRPGPRCSGWRATATGRRRLRRAEAHVGDSAFLAAALARARAAGENDDELLRVALAGFEKCGTRLEAAKTAWALGGAAREDAARVFAELRVPPPAARRAAGGARLGLAEAPGERHHHRPRGLGMIGDETLELPGSDAAAAQVGGGDHGRRAGPVVDQGDLAEVVAGAEGSDLLAADADVGVARLDQPESGAAASLLDRGLALGEGALATSGRRAWRAPCGRRRRRAAPCRASPRRRSCG